MPGHGKREYGGKIINQLKKLGASADWDRERFTMDEGCSKAVKEVFIRLYEKGYIYKGSRIINWCPVCKTSISDAEVEHEEQDGFFWHINYPIVGRRRPISLKSQPPVRKHCSAILQLQLTRKMKDTKI